MPLAIVKHSKSNLEVTQPATHNPKTNVCKGNHLLFLSYANKHITRTITGGPMFSTLLWNSGLMMNGFWQKIDGPAVGIDLGTTYSCVGIWQNERVEIIANDQGNRTTPSWVAFTESERLIGDAAKNQAAMNPSNTVFDAKRLIGRKLDDAAIQQDLKHWPFKVIGKDGNKPHIQGV
jgi:hypothetical protein